MKIADLFKVEGYGVVVTGGASGLGLAFTEALAENGARVTMLDIDSQRIANETRRLKEQGYDVRGAVVDVTDHRTLPSPDFPPDRRMNRGEPARPYLPSDHPARSGRPAMQ